MKTYNHVYNGGKTLNIFIDAHPEFTQASLLIQVFTCFDDINKISELCLNLKKQLPNAVIIGATTDGEISDGISRENTTVIAFSIFEKTNLKAGIFQYKDSQYIIGRNLVKTLVTTDTRALILFGDGLKTNGDELLRGIFKENPDIIVAGGLAGDYRKLIKTYVILNTVVLDNAIVAVSLNNPDLQVNNRYVFEWRTIGQKMQVTKAIKNRLYEVNDMSLVNAYIKYLGQAVSDRLPASAGEFPLIISRHGVNVARAAILKHPDGSMSFAGNFRTGDTVQFGYGYLPGIRAAIETNTLALSQMAAESIFIYSCSARKVFLKEDITKEIEPVEKIATTTGFFCYGEFYHSSKQNELLNETMTLLVLSEKSKPSINKPLHATIKSQKSDLVSDTLFHLINATGEESRNLTETLTIKVKEKTKELTRQYYTDTLCELPNRNQLAKDLSGQSIYMPSMLAVFNLDHFKEINNFFGENKGDLFLQKISEKLVEILKKYQANGIKLYKLHGDEFIVTASENVGENEFIKLIELCVSAIDSEDIRIEDDIFGINVTVGVSLGKRLSQDFNDQEKSLLKQANIAMKEAKNKRSNIVIYDPALTINKLLERNVFWTKKTRLACKENRIVPYFQPILNAKTNKIDKYECLARLIDTDGTAIAPIYFLEVAKRSKLYPWITCCMVEKSILAFKNRNEQFSVNLSIEDIGNFTTVDFIKAKILEHNIAEKIIFEILESEAIDDYSIVVQFIREMKAMGCRISIDDFGSGYSNFKHIINLPIDFIKIDGSLIKTIDTDPKTRILVETIINFCKNLNIETVAEFVHNEAIANIVKKLGIDYLQGHFIGRAKPWKVF